MYDPGASQLRRSNGGQCCFRVESRLSFLDLFLRPSRESNELFLGAASATSRPEIISIAGKNFLYQDKSENYAMLKMFVQHTRLKCNISVVCC